MLLAGDVVGTKTDLAIFSNEAGPHAPLARAEVRSADYPSLQTPRFMESIKRKGRLSELMERIPIHVVITRAALIGAAAYGLGRFKDGSA